ncbi:YkgJ family cysteine cluster protein [Haloarcula onubensis]|uniref:YkgJ family cysteine cluster protein n=1 Tax=Haloarcula onubensis TaxID=2950539 RepID=A0ABU2FNR9_9EURY|nr:YkgJ family cysteine cluster protein [Halomicroarcula sp. S3CR25-11]MDS0282398.1 YkgJ family cysteine cluster protein [Halomicroarcula sp. S3CR25-11]
MEVDCEGCAGCCIDWRPLTGRDIDHERRGPFEPLDDAYNLVPLAREEVRAFVDAGYGDALRPRLWRADDDRSVTLDGVDVAAIDGRPVFFVGLRKPPKPVAPFDRPTTWLRSCVFLDPTTLQCRVHDDDLYPDACATYPGENLLLETESECERVESVHGGRRLLDDEPPDVTPRFGPGAVGERVFAHPEPDRVESRVGRFRDGDPTPEDRAEFVAVAAASSPGTLAVNGERYEQALEAVLRADSWAGRAIDRWERAAVADGKRARDAPDPGVVEDADGAPSTPGW